MEINIKSKNDQCDNTEKKIAVYETIATSVSLTNANIFLITDKKSRLLIIYLHIVAFIK